MKKILSILFNKDRTYLTGITLENSNVSLDYINSTNNFIDFSDVNSDETMKGIAELNDLFLKTEFIPDEINVALPSESVFISKFPTFPNITNDNLNKLIKLELGQMFPQKTIDSFSTKLTSLLPENESLQRMLLVAIPEEHIDFINSLVQNFNKPITQINITQQNAQISFLYNYPEMVNKVVMLISLQGDYIDVSILDSRSMIYFNIIKTTDTSKTTDLIIREFHKIVPNYVPKIDVCFLFGSALTKSINLSIINALYELGISDIKRLNAFRMLKSNLTKRENEYCSRTFHIYPSCIGTEHYNKLI